MARSRTGGLPDPPSPPVQRAGTLDVMSATRADRRRGGTTTVPGGCLAPSSSRKVPADVRGQLPHEPLNSRDTDRFVDTVPADPVVEIVVDHVVVNGAVDEHPVDDGTRDAEDAPAMTVPGTPPGPDIPVPTPGGTRSHPGGAGRARDPSGAGPPRDTRPAGDTGPAPHTGPALDTRGARRAGDPVDPGAPGVAAGRCGAVGGRNQCSRGRRIRFRSSPPRPHRRPSSRCPSSRQRRGRPRCRSSPPERDRHRCRR